MTTPFTLVSASSTDSGKTPKTLYTVPAGKQAFIKSVIANNRNTNTGVSAYLGITDTDSNYTQLSSPQLATAASTNTLAGTLVMSAGESLTQSASSEFFVPESVVYNSTGTFMTGAKISDFIYANGKYIAIGFRSGSDPYNNFIVVSSDGVSWTWVDVDTGSSIERDLRSIAYGAGVFVVVGANSFIATSPDGITWTRRTSAYAANLNSVVFAAGKFVVVGGSTASNSIQTSTDGIAWTGRTGSTSTVNSNYAYVTHDPISGLFAMSTGQAGDAGGIQTSPDGITWTQCTLPNTANVYGVAAKPGLFLAIPSTATSASKSSDGVNWVSSIGIVATPLSVQYVQDVFLIHYTSGQYLAVDSDAMSSKSIVCNNLLGKFIYDGTNWFAVTSAGASQAMIYKTKAPNVSRAVDWTASIIEVAA